MSPINHFYYRLIGAVLLSLIAILTGFQTNIFDGTIEAAKTVSKPYQGLTYADILRLKQDMALYEVEAIFGQGTKVSENKSIVSYRWKYSEQGWLICEFDRENSRLVSWKEQRLES